MKIVLMVVALLLAGCASAPAVVQPVEVKVPVAMPCKVAGPLKPDWPTAGLQPGALRAEWRELKLRQAYEVEFEAALKA